jgi:transposase
MKTLPVEYRLRVIALTEEGYTTSEIAEVLGTSGAWVRSIKALHRSGRSLAPKSRANKRTSLAEREGERIRAQVKAKPGSTLEDLKRDLELSVSISSLWYALRDLKISLKKSPSTPPSRSGPTSPPPARTGKSSRPRSTRPASFSSTKPSAPPP